MLSTCSNCFAEIPDGESTCPVCGYSSDKDSGKYPMALPAGTVLNGRYILGRTLGQGGFGITYVAKDHKTGNLVAVKEYFPETLATRTTDKTISAYTDQREENFSYGKECFLKEAETLAQFIGNPNIVRVYSYFEENNTAYFVMDYVDGVSLRDYLKEHGKISWEEAKKLLFPIMDALSEVHSKGIIHRDVTPDNIYITKDGVVKLLDFGAARYSLGDRSRSLDVVLKPGFAPREQYSRHSRQGPYTDVYALAATYYFAITGRLPPDSIDRQDHDELILPSSLGVKIPPEEEDALCKGLSVSSLERFQNMEEFKQAIETHFIKDNSIENKTDEASKIAINGVDKPKDKPADETKKINKKELVEEKDRKSRKKFTKKTAVIAACACVLVISIIVGVVSSSVGKVDTKPITAITQKETEKTQTATTKNTEKNTEAVTESKLNLEIKPDNTSISAGFYHTVGLKNDGTVVAVGYDVCGVNDVVNWTDVVSISAGQYHTIGLKSDGTVLAAGKDMWDQCNVEDWDNIVAVSAGDYHTVGLKNNGTVVAVGLNNAGQCNVTNWTDIVAISVGQYHTVGLKSDGTVVAVGENKDGQCDVENWSDIIAISAGQLYTVGLKIDGTVVAVGDNEYGQCNVNDWNDIISISAGDFHTVGIKSDRKIVAVGNNKFEQCNVNNWSNIVSISGGSIFTVGLKSDGAVIAIGYNENGQCDVKDWTDIKVPED